MIRLLAIVTVALGAMICCAPASAQELSGPCPVGAQVADRQGNTGTVVDTDEVGCHVQLQNGQKTYYLSWMLHMAGGSIHAPGEMAGIPPGRYTCFTGQPLHYIFMDINIRGGGAYTDVQGNPGAYSYDPGSQVITFRSGSFRGQYAKYLGREGIGLASQPTDFFNTVCDREN